MKNCLFINNKWMISCSLLVLAYAGDVMAMYDSESNVSQSSSDLASPSNDSSQSNKIAQKTMEPGEYKQWIDAAKKGNYNLIESFIKKGVNVNQLQRGESPALLYAAAYGHIEIVKLLVENGADVNLKDDDGGTPLEYAVCKIKPKVVKYLLEKKADANVKNKEGITPIMRFLGGVPAGQGIKDEDLKEIVKLLIKYGADVNEHGKHGYSLLTYALRFIKNPKDLVIYLVEHGADIGYDDQDQHGLVKEWPDDSRPNYNYVTFHEGLIGTPLEIAKAQGYTEIVDYLKLMERNKIISSPIDSSNDSSQSNKIAQKTMEPGEYKQWIDAAKKGNYNLIESFIKKGVNVNQLQRGESPALLYAAAYGHIEIVKLLVENGADVNLKDDDGGTPLEYAVCKIKPKVVKYLLEKEADANVKNKEGMTPIMRFLGGIPAEQGIKDEDLKEIVKLLVEYGANVNEHGKDGYSLLTYALRFIKNPKDLVIYLVEHGADIGYDDQDDLGLVNEWPNDSNPYCKYVVPNKGLIGTPLEIAKAQGYTEIVDYLKLMERNKIISYLIENKNNRKNSNNKGEED